MFILIMELYNKKSSLIYWWIKIWTTAFIKKMWECGLSETIQGLPLVLPHKGKASDHQEPGTSISWPSGSPRPRTMALDCRAILIWYPRILSKGYTLSFPGSVSLWYVKLLPKFVYLSISPYTYTQMFYHSVL